MSSFRGAIKRKMRSSFQRSVVVYRVGVGMVAVTDGPASVELSSNLPARRRSASSPFHFLQHRRIQQVRHRYDDAAPIRLLLPR